MVCSISILICLKIFLNFSIYSLLTHWLFSCMLFKLYIFVNFPGFCMQLIFSCIPLWLEKMFDIISILLNLLWLIFWANLWPVLEIVLCTLEKNIYSVVWMECSINMLSPISPNLQMWRYAQEKFIKYQIYLPKAFGGINVIFGGNQ